MKLGLSLVKFSVKNPKTVTTIMAAGALLLVALAALPTIWPDNFPFLTPAIVDTDPENMLAKDEPVRLFHQQRKAQYGLYDMIVLGVVNKTHPNGVFNVKSLTAIYELTEYAKNLSWDDPENPGKREGVISFELLAPSTVDSMESGSLGEVKFNWLMPVPPSNDEEALAVRRKAERLPFMQGTLISEDGKALCLYIPLTSKDLGYKVSDALKEKIALLDTGDEYHITGLPVAEDTFGIEMFYQMALSAPMAMGLIFLMLRYFFRKLSLIIAPLIVAMVAVMYTMGLLVVSGNTIHIMSSMIPIFIMPIAVLDAIHILSEFYDRYQKHKHQENAVMAVMETLFTPMLYTSLTTAAGFASLALTPIPPVQVFGMFIAFGVMAAWLWTITFIPAWIMLLKPESLSSYGMQTGVEEKDNLMTRSLGFIRRFTSLRPRLIMAIVIILIAVSAYGINQIVINDNPVKWFEPKHPIRIADLELNAHFGGTYMAYLEISPTTMLPDITATKAEMANILSKNSLVKPVIAELGQLLDDTAKVAKNRQDFFQRLAKGIDQSLDNAPDEQYYAFDKASLAVSAAMQEDEIFKDPKLLNWLATFQKYLTEIRSPDGRILIGKSNSLADIVKTVYRELNGGDDKYLVLPDSAAGVAQSILQFESSHRPRDLWHFVDKGDANNPPYRKLSLWVQLKSGDNRDMSTVIRKVNDYISENPAPTPIESNWFGLTYINVEWQDKMVGGMLKSFIGAFLVSLLMMTILFRSALWGILSMIPLTVTIGAIYGAIGLIGKDYDMPVAVLSSLSLGLAVDYAIHFLIRSRELVKKHGSWQAAISLIFGEPSRAIARNVLVVGIGFLPLLAAPLLPYQTVGIFIAAILISAGIATLIILPVLETLLSRWLFHPSHESLSCKCGTCTFAGLVFALLLVVSLNQFT